jgi:hypothetical protein
VVEIVDHTGPQNALASIKEMVKRQELRTKDELESRDLLLLSHDERLKTRRK